MRVGEDSIGVGDTPGLGDGVGVGVLIAVGLEREAGVGTVVCVGGPTVDNACVQATKLIATASTIVPAVFAIVCTGP